MHRQQANSKECVSEWVVALLLPNREGGAQHPVLERQADVYFIPIGNPFVEPEKGIKIESEDEAPRIVQNQIAIRGAKIAGRGLTSLGATALAGSAALARKPIRQGRFSVVDKKTYNRRLKEGSVKPEHRGQKVTRFKRNVRVYGQIDVQERRARARPERRRRQRVTALRGAGTLATVSGALLPMLAYGHIATQYLDMTELLYGEPGDAIQTERLVKDVSWIDQQLAADVVYAMTLIDTGVTVAQAIKGTVKEVL